MSRTCSEGINKRGFPQSEASAFLFCLDLFFVVVEYDLEGGIIYFLTVGDMERFHRF